MILGLYFFPLATEFGTNSKFVYKAEVKSSKQLLFVHNNNNIYVEKTC